MFHPPIGWLNCVLSPNRLDMSVTRLTSQLGMSLHAAAPHRYAVVVGSSPAGSDEQHWSPVPPGTGPRQLFTAAWRSALFVKGSGGAMQSYSSKLWIAPPEPCKKAGP